MEEKQKGAVLRQLAMCAALFTAILALGLLTRPLAHLFPTVYGAHALLVALPYSFCLAFFMRRGLRLRWCVAAPLLFAGILFMMNPIMGSSGLIAIGLAGVVALLFGRSSGDVERKAGLTQGIKARFDRGVVFAAAFGALYFPSTLIAATLLGGYLAHLESTAVLVTALEIILGAALSVFGVALATCLGLPAQCGSR